jgi:LacI family transcriptional regulator
MATIYEVATLAGVSPATVSRVFNGHKVSKGKIHLVRAAAKKLQFEPNRTARTLRRQRSDLMALVIPDIENPFFTSLARGVEDVAQSAGYSVVLCNTDEDYEKELCYFEIIMSENMAGVILAAAGDRSDLSGLISRGRPIVAVDRGPHGFNIDSVMVDNRAGGIAATQDLINQGFKRIACITGPSDVETAQQRTDGWRAALKLLKGNKQPESYLRHANNRVDGGREAMSALLSLNPPPDAVFITNNLMCVGALQVLSERGISPSSIGVAVFGDLPFNISSERVNKIIPLDARQLGATAAKLLLERINGDEQPTRTVVLHNEII